MSPVYHTFTYPPYSFRMHTTLIIFILISVSHQIEINKDNDHKGLILSELGNVKIHEKTKFLYYNFNITSVRTMLKWNNASHRNCYNNYTNASPLLVQLTENLKWNIYKPLPKLSKNNTVQLTSSLNFDKVLSNYMTQMKNESNIDCKTLRTLTNQFIEMNNYLNSIAIKLNTTSIEKIIDKSLFLRTIYDMIDENLVLPSIINENTTKTFFDNTKIEYFQDSFTITLKFEIPLYLQTQIYKVFLKPILKKRGPMIARTNVTHAARIGSKYTFWNSTEFNTLCYVRGDTNSEFGETFICEKSISNHKCETELLTSNIRDKTCLKKLAKRNIITRIYKKFYKTIYNPMVIQIICEHFEYFIQIIEDSYLLNDKNCFINGSFYSYNPIDRKHSIEPYEMKISNQITSFDFNFWNTDSLDSNEFIILFSLVLCVLLSFNLAIITIIYVAKGKIDQLRNIAEENAYHDYATVEYYSNPFPYYGTEV